MTHRITYLAAAAALSLLAGTATAQCSVEYKAKKDNPLRLEHGTMVVPGPCSDAEAQAREELAARGWTLLKVLSLSDK